MAYINQTNKTILFEEFSRADGVPRMDFLLRSYAQLTHLKLKKELTVKSFDEFMEKFDPKYYEYTTLAEGQEIPTFEYGLEKPLKGGIEHRLVEQPFYKAMLQLYNEKGKSGENNFVFDFNQITDRAYSPKKAMEDVQDIRAKLVYNTNELLKIEKNHGPDNEKSEYVKEITNLRKRIKKDYLTMNPFNLLPIMIEDTRDRLKAGMTKDFGSSDGNEKVGQQVLITFDGTGKPKYLEQKADLSVDAGKSQALLNSSADNSTTKLIGWIGNDFDKAKEKGKNLLVVEGNEESNNFMKNMLVSVFAGKSLELPNVTKSELENNLRIYEQMYSSSQKNFAQAVVGLVEKIICVKAFFDHAGGNAELIVSNCSIDKLKDNPNFKEFIRAEGEEINDERVWFAIIPAVDHKDFVSINTVKKATNLDDLDLEDEDDDDDNADNKDSKLLPFSSLKEMLDLFGSKGIITFFNFKGCENTSSTMLSEELVKNYKSELEPISQGETGDYAVFCYPNFTVLPERNSSVKIGNEFIKLPSVYIEASYVACGLYVKCQNNEELQKKAFNVNSSLGCPVRFNFEGSFITKNDNQKTLLSQIFTTSINRENLLSWPEDLKREIGYKDGGFGFCFCGDQMFYDYKGKIGIEQQNAYVFRARTLGKDQVKDDEGKPTGEVRYRPIFKTLIKTYLTKISKKANPDQIKNLCALYTQRRNKENINNLLYSPDFSNVKISEEINFENKKIDIKYDKDSDDFDLEFNEN